VTEYEPRSDLRPCLVRRSVSVPGTIGGHRL
jgi:hypothetical protein